MYADLHLFNALVQLQMDCFIDPFGKFFEGNWQDEDVVGVSDLHLFSEITVYLFWNFD